MRCLWLVCLCVGLLGCDSEVSDGGGAQEVGGSSSVVVDPAQLVEVPGRPLPEGLVWVSNVADPIFASPKAKKGGVFRTFLLDFPLTLRTVGPDSNSSFRGALLGNQLGLTAFHPDTENVIPELATHWAYDDDGRTVYYKLDPDARWSDGVPVTADDFVFALKFMRSDFIVAPWYQHHYTEMVKDVVKFDAHTIAVVGATVRPKKDLHLYYGFAPRPRHFHRLDEHWVQGYNWRVEPNTGPYQISKLDKGNVVEFALKKDWWARDRRYFKYRFNVKMVRFKVIRDMGVAFKHFLKGSLDAFSLVRPVFWHDKAQGPLFDQGYIRKYVFYNDRPRSARGFYLNLKYGLLQDPNVRFALAHAMNVEKLLQTILRGDYARLDTMHMGYGVYTNSAFRARGFDLALVDRYLKKSGWSSRGSDGIRVKDGQRLSVRVAFSNSEDQAQLVLLKEEAKKAGVELVLQQLSPASAYKQTMEKKHQIAWMAWGTGLRPAYWQHFHSDNADKPQTNNITNTADPEMDRLIMAYRQASTEKARIGLAHQLEQLVHDSGVYIPTYYVPYTRSGAWRWVQLPDFLASKLDDGLFSPFGNGGVFWVDEDLKAETLQAKKRGVPFVESDVVVDVRYRVSGAVL